MSEFEGLPQAIENETTQAESLPQETVREITSEQAQQLEGKADYQGFVDLSTIEDENLRNAIDGRFKHISQLMKKQGRESRGTINELKKIATEQARMIEELSGGMGAVVNHLQTQTFAQTESQLKAQLRQARDNGDYDAEADILDRLAEVKAQKLATKNQPKPQKPQPQQPYNSGSQIAQEAVLDGDLDPQDAMLVQVWQDELDSAGTPLRPWAAATRDNDPAFQRALFEMSAVFHPSSPYANLSMQQKLAELDKRMGTKKSNPQQSVLGGGFTPRPKNNTVKLTPDAERIAVKTKYAGPGKTDAEHIAAYKKQMEQVNASRRA